jgi:hypothetical protein
MNCKWKIAIVSFCIITLLQNVKAQNCKTTAELDATPGKYLTASQYPWPAVRAEYFNKMNTTADKAIARKTLEQLEIIEQKSRTGFNLTGGNWENTYYSQGYLHVGKTILGQYSLQSALYELFCANGKVTRNSEYSTVLRMYVNAIPANNLSRFINLPFGSSMGDYDLGFQYMDWKNHKPADVDAALISLFAFFTCNNDELIEAINSGSKYFQDVPEKEIKLNNRSNYITRFWFVTKGNLPVLVPVSRKEYLQSLLEYYEREKLYFPKLIAKLNQDHDAGVKQYNNWQADVADKIAVVNKVINEHDEEWLSAPAIINHSEDLSQNYKAKLTERTNYNRFWKFYDAEKKGESLYKYNPAYFSATQVAAKPQLIAIAFRFVTMPSSLRLVDNFSKHFDFEALRKFLEK